METDPCLHCPEVETFIYETSCTELMEVYFSDRRKYCFYNNFIVFVTPMKQVRPFLKLVTALSSCSGQAPWTHVHFAVINFSRYRSERVMATGGSVDIL